MNCLRRCWSLVFFSLSAAFAGTAVPVPDARIQDPESLRAACAAYFPESARRSEERGNVGLLIEVGPEGNVVHARIEKSSGYDDLDQAAVRCITDKGTFDPTNRLQHLTWAWTGHGESTASYVYMPPERPTIHLTLEGRVYKTEARINDTITLKFIIDSGASDVVIPLDVAKTLLRMDAIEQSDFLGEGAYVTADGSEHHDSRIRIRSLRVGDVEVKNVTASVSPIQGDLLLGQSFLGKMKSWMIDNDAKVLILNK